MAAQVKRNIENTIGVPWELILMDNSVMKKGITEVYNIGAQQSRFDILCFVHEDVLFRAENWGSKIAGYFEQDPELGIIGVAGSKYKSKTLSGWATGINEFDCCNIMHVDNEGREQRIYLNPDNVKDIQRTLTIDGVFMCTRKPVWQRLHFNETLLKGFHVYDIDYSVRVSKSHKVAVTFEIETSHFTTGGDFGNAWMNDTTKWHKANNNSLPCYLPQDEKLNIDKIETIIKKNWLHRLKGEQITFRNRMKWLIQSRAYRHVEMWPVIFVFLFFVLIKISQHE